MSVHRLELSKLMFDLFGLQFRQFDRRLFIISSIYRSDGVVGIQLKWKEEAEVVWEVNKSIGIRMPPKT